MNEDLQFRVPIYDVRSNPARLKNNVRYQNVGLFALKEPHARYSNKVQDEKILSIGLSNSVGDIVPVII